MDAITLQPAAGAHGELTGLLIVRAYHESKGQSAQKSPDSRFRARHQSRHRRHVPATRSKISSPNPVGMVDVAALEAQMNDDVAALMLTNPNTLGVFEQEIHKIAEILHAKGGLLYMDGANMNALVGKVRPGDFGVDVMHLNLHKTFSTPHGGGGPGSGPVAVKSTLEPFLPTPVVITKNDGTLGFEYNRPQSVGTRSRLLWKFWRVRAGAGVHSCQRSRRPAPGHRRRGAERELHPQRPRRRFRSALFDAQHARGRVQRQAAGKERRQDRWTSPSVSSTTAFIPTPRRFR